MVGNKDLFPIQRVRSIQEKPGRIFRLALGVILPVSGQLLASAQQIRFDQGLSANVLQPRPGLHLGRFDFHGGMFATAAYDDLVQRDASGGGEDDFAWTASPFLTARTEGPNSRTLQLSYQPSFVFYTKHSDLNSINHSGSFSLIFPFNRLKLSLWANVGVASVIVRDIGDRATQQSYSVTGSADYELSDKTTLQGSVTYGRSDFGGQFISSDQFTEQVFADYHFSDRLSTGVGVMATQFQVEDAPGQTSEGPQVRMEYKPNAQLKLSASFGVTMQQFEESSTAIAETFSVGAAYQMRPGTMLTLDATRSEQPSGVDAGQNYTATSLTATVNQTLPHRMVLNLSGGYTQAEYYATQEGIATSRLDNYFFIRSDLTYSLSTAWNFGLFVEHDSNTSSGGNFGYDHNIAGLRAGWSF